MSRRPDLSLASDAALTYRYDGTFEGFLCCVFESYTAHELPAAIVGPDAVELPLFGVKSAWRITRARRAAALTWDALAKIGVVTKRARHFLLANGKRCFDAPAAKEEMLLDLMSPRERALFRTETASVRQLFLFGEETPTLSPAERKELSCLAAPI